MELIEYLEQEKGRIQKINNDAETEIKKIQERIRIAVKKYMQYRADCLLKYLKDNIIITNCEGCGKQFKTDDQIFLIFKTDRPVGEDGNEELFEGNWEKKILKVCRDCSIFLSALNGTYFECKNTKKRQTVTYYSLITDSKKLQESGQIATFNSTFVYEYFKSKGTPKEIIIGSDGEIFSEGKIYSLDPNSIRILIAKI
ncbi:MAG: hypothetical protein PHX25_01585 [Candidatus Pacebacteria bacterium]|nr:hypothetical protein [Candidatus Paceibacterota bacterium]